MSSTETLAPLDCFDCETRLTVPGNPVPEVICAGYITASLGAVSPELRMAAIAVQTPEQCAQRLRAALQAGHRFVGHNIPFDWAVMCRVDPTLLPLIFEAYEQGRVHDTFVREKLIFIAQGRLKYDHVFNTRPRFGLADCLLRYTGKDVRESKKDAESWRFRFVELENTPLSQWPVEALDYVRSDVEHTLEVYYAQCDEFPSDGGAYLTNEREQVYAAFAFHLMGAWGIRTDPKAVRRLTHTVSDVVRASKAELLAEGILRAGGTKNMTALRNRVVLAYETQGKPTPKTEKNNISTSRKTLEQSRDPVLRRLAEAGKSEKILTTFVPVLEQGTMRPINAGWNVLVESGRSSCRNPNLQNLSRKGGVRDCFVSRPGRVFIGADYSSCELCTLAQVCIDLFGASALGDAIRAGLDPHMDFGSWMLGITYDEMMQRYKAGDRVALDARQQAKVADFGFPGGLGPQTFVDFAENWGLKMTLERSRELREQWFAKWPEMRLYFRHIQQLTGNRQYFSITQLRSNRIRANVTFTAAANSLFQGLASDGAKAALAETARQCYVDRISPLFGCRPVLFIHDEIVISCPERADYRAVAQRLEQVMIEQMQPWTPDIPVSVEAVVFRRWSKDAKPVYAQNGNLLAWEHPMDATPQPEFVFHDF
jgi:DNA polymerase I-like protein with 3'-5' exonuclease and polymerase domains